MLFVSPKVAHKLFWKVQNTSEGTTDLLPIVVTEGPTGGSRSTVRAIVLRKRRDGSGEYLDAVSVPERFLEIRDELFDAIDGPADSPYTLSELMDKAIAQRQEHEASQQAAAQIAS